MPARGADTPAVTGLQTRKIVVGHRGGEIVAGVTAEGQELGGDLNADRVAAVVIGAGVALAVAEKAGEGVERARL